MKLSAGIDKSGIGLRACRRRYPTSRLFSSLRRNRPKRCMSRAPEPEPAPESAERGRKPCPDAGKAARSASFGGCNRGVPRKFGLSSLEQPAGAGRLPSGLPAGMGKQRSTSRDTARRPLARVLRYGQPLWPSCPHIPREAGRTPGAAPADRGVYRTSGSPGKRAPSWMDTAWDIVRLRSVHPIRTAENMLRAIRDTMAISSVVGISKAATGPLAAAMDISSSAAISLLPRRFTITTYCTAWRATRNLQPRLRKARFPIC